MPGIFTVSLDLELYWGVRDARSIASYESNLRGERDAIRGMLQLFDEHAVHATWATLGFLFYKDADELRRNLPEVLPDYRRQQLSSYRYLQEHAWNTADDPYHFAPEMVELIRDYDGQEIGTHTFSHYYCLEDGQTLEAFRADLKAALAAARSHGIPIASLVFPRNQSNQEYLAVLDELGIACYRGNENAAFYTPRNQREQNLIVRASRLLDSYINLSGYHTYALEDCARSRPFNIPSSRFLRPYSRSLAPLEGLRLRRIKRAMLDAATGGRLFHLWWHPHNFGANTARNLACLAEVLGYYGYLRERFGMQSLNMGEVANLLEDMHAGQA
ncbi:polysaccharide deacetylase family protein [Dyella marensis]|uniref:Polysaccharide deacetylase n=1 Tax=Dyella marensis TaxID=500610 RepID=A0A1I2ID28_9GAMM|nr:MULTISPECIES: polysaccharide deacetylase family protein [Dyella]SFF40272.1 Polysaccharide deacetylase [Dyella marensis]